MSGPSTSGWVNSGSISWSIADNGSPASGVAGYTAQWDSDPGDPSSQATPGSGNSYYSGPASAHGATSGTASLLTGCHTLFVRAWDNIGESAVNSYGTVCYDPTAPSITTPTVDFRTNVAVLANNAALLRIKWTGSDALSGISQFLLWQSVDGGAYTQFSLPSPTATQYDVRAQPGHSYTYALGAYDNAGNFAGYLFSVTRTLSSYQENSSAITYAPAWPIDADATALGGATAHTAGANRTATFAFNGSKVLWVTPRDVNHGQASITVDGGAPVTVDTHNGAVQPRRAMYRAAVGNGNHTLVLKCLGTAGHPRIDVDAFYVLN
jgi:hypothetical protein